ncbi:MAG TPA: hypothetical protein VER04_05050 [Polyangiaceae bacterium]|nr:hypothetical protein [Polyangiaceae bacterium]
MKIKALRGVARASFFAIALPYAFLTGCGPKDRSFNENQSGASGMNEGGGGKGATSGAGSTSGGTRSAGGSPSPNTGGKPDSTTGGNGGPGMSDAGGGEGGEPAVVDHCDPNPCENDGACSSDGSCNCQTGFSGATCAVKLDPCADAPCQNGATCSEQGTDFKCACTDGYEGKTCSDEVDDCVPNQCLNGGTCEDGHNTFSCHCPDGYSGTKCEREVHGCADSPCLSGASCTDSGSVYTCHCPAGYSGSNCETNINECSPNPCKNGGSCADGVNSYSCSCAAGYSGPTCQTNIDDCASNPCKNGGSCADGVNSYACSCTAGWSGATCQTNIDDCSPNPCKNGGSCADGVNSYSCSCAAGYSGSTCQTNIDDCASNPCKNGGSCADGVNSFTCSCASGWSGNTCETNLNVTLTVTATGPAGSVTSVPAGQITCTAPNSGGGCSKAYPPGTTITLNAKATNGTLTRFAGWTGACSGIGQTCTFTLDGAKTVGASFVSRTNNLVFVSSATYDTNLGSAVAYDAKCNDLATAAGINNASGNGYIAWTSDSSSDATTRLGSAQNFILMDGRPFGRTKASFLNDNAILYPIRLSEKGVDVGEAEVMSGTESDGTYASPEATCNNWTGAVALSDGVLAGSSLGGPMTWGGGGVVACNKAKRVFCFSKTETAALAFTPATGKRIWLSSQYIHTTAADPDSHCALSMPAGVSSARALVAYSSAPASDALNPSTTYVRPDGVVVGTGAEITAQTPRSGVWQNADGSYVDEFDNGSVVFVGATSLTANGATTCNNWTDQSGSSSVVAGNFHTAGKNFWNYISITCNVSSRLYCIEP